LRLGMERRNGNGYSRVKCGVELASGVRLTVDTGQPDSVVLVFAGAQVQLNRSAAAVLELCDGSRSRERLVADVVWSSGRSASAADVVEFLDAAQKRGWIVDVQL